MEKRDARTLKMEVRQELRYQVVRMKKAGMKNQDVAKLVGLSIPTTSGIWAKYKREGMKGLILKTRGRKEGEKRNLTPKEESLIIKRLIDTTPPTAKI